MSCFQKRMLNAKIEKIKAYRKQFEDDDSSFKSFREPRSNSPSTPRVLSRKPFCQDALASSPTQQQVE